MTKTLKNTNAWQENIENAKAVFAEISSILKVKLKTPLKGKTDSELLDILEYLDRLFAIIAYYPDEDGFHWNINTFRKCRIEACMLLLKYFDAQSECERLLEILRREKEQFAASGENTEWLGSLRGVDQQMSEDIEFINSWLEEIRSHLKNS
ncbi:hypothetical protein LJC12_04390 [Odoribacter sp. OttesenSCG-928-J03]|nr:hypothetical protein [Odoribacter sp. OttesenSCG-928-J03]MDL2283145.1 hypothetical protein [Odoribacter sp. OttesenSCG-928-G04]MDL2330501.1 hypothetical protein [Odoribacter sp. OttesenSCG-928-A06]